MPVLPIATPLPLVLLLVSVPPIVMLLPPAPSMLFPSSDSEPLPLTETFPLTDWVTPGS